jgi:hypothetical protein
MVLLVQLPGTLAALAWLLACFSPANPYLRALLMLLAAILSFFGGGFSAAASGMIAFNPKYNDDTQRFCKVAMCFHGLLLVSSIVIFILPSISRSGVMR